MRRILKAVFLNAMLVIAGNDVWAQGIRLPSAFITGQAFAGLPENARTQYVKGLVDGIFVAVLHLSRKGKHIGEMPGWAGQQANWCKLVEVHSGAARGQREGAHVIFYRQMIEVCPGAGPAQ